MLIQTSHRALALVATLTLQSEWVLGPFLSIAAIANALCELTFRPSGTMENLAFPLILVLQING